jgi:hypothetical protein
LIDVTPAGTVKVCAPPVKLKVVVVGVRTVKIGVTVIVAVTGAVVALVAINEGILPVPLATRPIEVVLFVQLKVVPGVGLVKFTADVAPPLQTVWFGTGFTLVQPAGAL